jgi:hypothetical protein
LHRVGVFLQLQPLRFRTALGVPAADGSGTLEAFILDEPVDIGKRRLDAQNCLDAVAADPEADDNDRWNAVTEEENAGKDLAAYMLGFCIGDLLVSYAMHAPASEEEKAQRALRKLAELSTLNVNRLALGDALTDAMRPIYWDEKFMLRFAQAGGLPALIGDWVRSVSSLTEAAPTHTEPGRE